MALKSFQGFQLGLKWTQKALKSCRRPWEAYLKAYSTTSLKHKLASWLLIFSVDCTICGAASLPALLLGSDSITECDNFCSETLRVSYSLELKSFSAKSEATICGQTHERLYTEICKYLT